MTDLIPYSSLEVAGRVADEVTRQNIVRHYLERRSPETIRSFANGLNVFGIYLKEAGIACSGIILDLAHWQEADVDLSAWQHMTHGIINGFVRWQLQKGYTIGSIGVRLSVIKTLCQLATSAGHLPVAELALIKMVKGYSHKEGRNVDRNREVVRIGGKKPDAIVLSKEQVAQLKDQPDTPQGWRDRVLICLFFDHGLRCGELAQLKRSHIDMSAGQIAFYREKVGKHQNHKLTGDTILALMNYFQYTNLSLNDLLLMGSQRGKGGTRLQGCMSKRAITARVNALGKRIGIDNLSAHDGRHTWATSAKNGGTNIVDLADAGGWSGITVPYSRYVERNKIANSGVHLDY